MLALLKDLFCESNLNLKRNIITVLFQKFSNNIFFVFFCSRQRSTIRRSQSLPERARCHRKRMDWPDETAKLQEIHVVVSVLNKITIHHFPFQFKVNKQMLMFLSSIQWKYKIFINFPTSENSICSEISRFPFRTNRNTVRSTWGEGEEGKRGGTINVCEIFGLPPFAIEMSAKHFPWRLIFNLNEAHGILSILKT